MDKSFDELEFDENYLGYEQISTGKWPSPSFDDCPVCNHKTLGILLCLNCGYERANDPSNPGSR